MRQVRVGEIAQHLYPQGLMPRLTTRHAEAADSARFEAIGRVICRHFPGPELSASGLWAGLLAPHAPVAELAMANDHAGVAAQISNLAGNGLGYGLLGLANIAEETVQTASDAQFRRVTAITLLDALISTAEALSLRVLENPPAAEPDAMRQDGDDIIRMIDARIGCEAATPAGFSGIFGIARPSGAICERRALSALCASERVLQLLRILGVPPAEAHVMEIGGGVGNLAYQCLRRGIGRYTIVDLPTVRAIQTYMACYNFPDMPLGFDAAADARLRLLLPDAVGDLPVNSVHLVVNEDSLPEMGAEVGVRYLREIARVGTGFFLSINHESRATLLGHRHTVVADLVNQVPELTCVGRTRHWVNRGYAEEIYAIGN